MLLLLLLALTASAASQNSSPAPVSHYDRRCDEDLSNLWLDVVAVVDNSKGMTNQGLTDIAANIASVFSLDTVIGSLPGNPKTTRVGLVTYDAQASVRATLDQYQSIDSLYDGVFTALSSVSNTEDSYLATGLAAAENLFLDGQISHPNRSHYQRVAIVYASAYKGSGDLNPVPVAERMKTNGITIITVAYDQDGDGALLADLELIATPHNNFANTDDGGNTIGEIQGALLQANCFCPNNWKQYRVDYHDSNSYRYGVCLQAIGLPAVWTAAKLSCRNRWPHSFLTTEFDESKHDYVLEVFKNVTGAKQPYTYHIGLSLVKGQWQWEQPDGQSPIPAVWTDWNPGFPQNSAWTGVLNMQPGSAQVSTGWQNVKSTATPADYVCEVASCDTANYCDSY